MDYELELVKLAECLDKIKVYEDLFHDIQLYRDVTMDNGSLLKALDIICDWSYAHRAGNGERTEDEVKEAVKRQFLRLKTGQYRKQLL
jgi:hypothetical protein